MASGGGSQKRKTFLSRTYRRRHSCTRSLVVPGCGHSCGVHAMVQHSDCAEKGPGKCAPMLGNFCSPWLNVLQLNQVGVGNVVRDCRGCATAPEAASFTCATSHWTVTTALQP